MVKPIWIIAFSVLATATYAQTSQASSSGMVSCPPNHYLSIDPPPQPTDDPAKADTYKPQTAVEKQQAEDQAKTNELARWHCLPLDAKPQEGGN